MLRRVPAAVNTTAGEYGTTFSTRTASL